VPGGISAGARGVRTGQRVAREALTPTVKGVRLLHNPAATAPERLRWHVTEAENAASINRTGFRPSPSHRQALPGVYVSEELKDAEQLARAKTGLVVLPVEVPEGNIASAKFVDGVRERLGLQLNDVDNDILVSELRDLGFVGADWRPGTQVFFGAEGPTSPARRALSAAVADRGGGERGGGTPLDPFGTAEPDDLRLRGGEEPAKPLPGQEGLFGGVVDETGQIAPMEGVDVRPQMGSMRGEGFRGEQGGLQPGMFTREEAGFAGQEQMRLEEAARVETPPTARKPDAPAPAVSQTLPAVNGIARERIRVKASDLEFRPELFQARDADAGKAFGETRVSQLVRAWDDAQFTDPSVVPDPENPGKYIVYAGHHRTEAFTRVKGADAELDVIVSHADLSNAEQLAAIRLEGDATNFATAVPNFREAIRAAQRAREAGLTEAQIGDRLRMTGAQIEGLADAERVGQIAIDRVVNEPGLEALIKEVGRGMRVYGISEEDAAGLFSRIANARKGQRPTPTALRETIDKFGAAFAKATEDQLQGGLFDAGQFEGFRSGLLGLMDENARVRTELSRQVNSTRRAQVGAQRLARTQGATQEDRLAAERLAALGQKEEERLRGLIEANEQDLVRAIAGEMPAPRPASPPEPPPPAEPRAALEALSDEGAQQADLGGALAPPAEGGPPSTVAPGPSAWGEPIDQLIEHIRSAAAIRPDLLQRRREVLAERVSQAAARLRSADPAMSADEAIRRSREALRGQLADPAFDVPGSLDADALHQAILDAMTRRDVPYFTGTTANDGLGKLVAGSIPAPHEVQALGQVFGPRLQEAIDEMGEVWKIQRRIEERLLREPIQITFPGGREMNATELGEALAAAMKDVPREQADLVAQRLIDADRVKVAIGKDGKPRVTSKSPDIDGLRNAVNREHGEFDEIPSQTLPPTQPSIGEESFQPSVSLAQTEGFPPEGPPAATRTLDQMRLERGLQESAGQGPYPPEGRALEAPARQPRSDTNLLFPGREFNPDQRNLLDHIWGNLQEVPAFPKALLATLDRSAPLRQGGLLIRRGRQVRDAMSKTLIIAEDAADAAKWEARLNLPAGTVPNAEDVMSALTHGKWSAVRERSGLYVGEWGPSASPSKREEQFMSKLADVLPGNKMSQRAYVVYLNKLRADVFDSVVEKWIRDGRGFGLAARKQITEKDLTDLATYLNAATGRGNLGQFEGAAQALSHLWFSPRMVVSRFQVLGQFFDPRTSGLVRMEMAKDLSVFFGTGIALLSMAKASGLADVELDPRSADFGRMRIGKTRIDFWGGYQQIARYGAQIITGQAKSSTGTTYDVDRINVFGRYLRSKLSPSAGVATNLLDDQDFTGAEYDLLSLKTVTDLFVPLFLQDVYDAVEDQGIRGLAYAPAAFFGATVSTYETPSERRNRTRDEVSRELNDGVAYAELLAKYPDSGFTRQKAVNDDSRVQGAVKKVEETSGNSEFGRQQQARRALSDQFDTRRQDAQAAFHENRLPRDLPAIWSDLAKEQAGARQGFEAGAKDLGFAKDEIDLMIDGYYDQAVYDAGMIDWDQTTLAQEKYLQGLPVNRRLLLEDFLGVQQREKDPLYQRYKKHVKQKEGLGYYRKGITQAEREALDRANPDVDAENWYFKGGVKDKNPPRLQSAQAVEKALAMADAKGRPVRIEKLDRPINQTPATVEAWRASSGRLDNFFNKAVQIYGDREANRLYGERGKPAVKYATLPERQQQSVERVIRTGLREASPELDAWLAWWGYGVTNKELTLHSRNAGKALQSIKQRYGDAPPAEGLRYRYAEDAR